MKIVLVGPELEENLSLRYLQSALGDAGHACSILPFNQSSGSAGVACAILGRAPGLVGFSLVAQRRYPEFQELARRLRRAGYRGHITAGGHFASLRAVEILRDTPGLDSILHHDGEGRLVALADGLGAQGRLPDGLDGVTWRGDDGTLQYRPAEQVADIDALSFPTRGRPRKTLGYACAPIVSSRGCAGACSFCSIHAWHRQVPAGRLRFRAPANVAEEMIALHRDHGVRVFIFHDDDFIHPDAAEAAARCRAILGAARRGIGRPFAFVIKCRPDDVEEKLFSYLKSEGLARVYVGIETNSEAGIRTLNRRTTPATNEKALAILERLGIYSCFNLLIFHPETTLDELEGNLGFLARHLDHPFDVARTELYARSALEDRLVREGRAIGDYRGYDYRMADPRAEFAFRLFADAFWDRHFREDSILHRAQDLGFRLSLLGRLRPEMTAPDLEGRVGSLIREVNADTVAYLRRLCAAAVDLSLRDRTGRAAWAEEIRREVKVRIRRQSARWTALSLELEGRAMLGRMDVSRFRGLVPLPRWAGAASGTPWLAVVLGAFSCSDSPRVCDPPPPPSVRFASEIEPHLDQTCAVSGCHSLEAAGAGLVLTADSSYTGLVGVPSTENPARMRVQVYHPEESYLLDKLQGTQLDAGGSGERMPPEQPADSAFTEKVRSWISQGAAKE